MNKIDYSMLESMYTSEDDEIKNDVSKSTHLEHTIKHLMKETRRFRREAHNLLRRGNNIKAEISLIYTRIPESNDSSLKI